MKKVNSLHQFAGMLVFVCVCALALAGCSGLGMGQPEEKAKSRQTLTGIVVMPTVVAKESVNKGQGEVTPASVAALVDGVLAAELGGKEQIRLVTEARLDSLLPSAAGGRLAQMQTLGAKLKANAVLDVKVTRYQERDGGDLAVNAPASAAFEMVLTHTETGMVLWAASFDETQQAVSSNLLALGKAKNRGYKWITVEELIRQGLKERLAECPYLQK